MVCEPQAHPVATPVMPAVVRVEFDPGRRTRKTVNELAPGIFRQGDSLDVKPFAIFPFKAPGFVLFVSQLGFMEPNLRAFDSNTGCHAPTCKG